MSKLFMSLYTETTCQYTLPAGMQLLNQADSIDKNLVEIENHFDFANHLVAWIQPVKSG